MTLYLQAVVEIEQAFAGNPVSVWIYALSTLAVMTAVLWVMKGFVILRLERFAARTETGVDEFIVILLRRSRYMLLTWLAIVIGLRFLTMTPALRMLLTRASVLAFLLQLGIWANGVIEFWVLRYTRTHHATSPTAITTFRAIAFAARLIAWAIVGLLVLDNFGVDITALITGLGIGGVAVALAVQNILGDVLAALAIMLDKPFVIGDFIIVGEEKGTVEQIGVKTTRLRSLGGEQIIFSNAELLRSRIRNYKRMEERRILFRFGVLYSTPPEIVERLPGIAREAVLAQGDVRFDRAHFAGFGDSSLDFEVVYYVLSAEYSRYMDVQQSINMYLLRALAAEGVDFAFPTRTLHLEMADASGAGLVAGPGVGRAASSSSGGAATPPR